MLNDDGAQRILELVRAACEASKARTPELWWFADLRMLELLRDAAPQESAMRELLSLCCQKWSSQRERIDDLEEEVSDLKDEVDELKFDVSQLEEARDARAIDNELQRDRASCLKSALVALQARELALDVSAYDRLCIDTLPETLAAFLENIGGV